MARAAVRDLLADASTTLAAAGIEAPRREARLLLAHVAGIDLARQLAFPDVTVPPGTAAAMVLAVARRAAHEPLAYVTGSREFWGRAFRVGPGVLIPRPETELLVELALATALGRAGVTRVLDIATGSGCLLATLLSEWPEAIGIGTDIAAEALTVAAQNVGTARLGGRALLVRTCWAEALAGPFDLVVANPPYVETSEIAGLEPGVRDFEPRAALDGGPDGLAAYRALLPHLPRLLTPTGTALLEIGRGQASAVTALAAASGFACRSFPDLAGVPRALRLTRRAGFAAP